MMDFRETDSAGQVNFPRRTIWASFASRSLNLKGASERLGPSVRVLACDDPHLVQGEFFWHGNRYGIGGVQTRDVQIVAKPIPYYTMM